MTKDEKKVIDALADARNLYQMLLPYGGKNEQFEFMQGIHRCQDIVLARTAIRGGVNEK